MNKKLLPAVSIGIAVLLIGSIAYASDRRKNAKSVGRPVDDIHEETLQAELLNDPKVKEKRPAASDDNKIIAAILSDDDHDDGKRAEVLPRATN